MLAPSPLTFDLAEPFPFPSYFHEDLVAKDYADFFADLHFALIPQPIYFGAGRRGHPLSAYIKALLVKTREKHTYVTDLRDFLVHHPPLILLLGFRPVVCADSPFGFDVEKTVPTARHLRRKLQTIENTYFQTLLSGTVNDLKREVPHFGRRIAQDNKHIYAWVKQNNKKAYVKDRFNPDCQPTGDPDCRLGVKRISNQDKKAHIDTNAQTEKKQADQNAPTQNRANEKEYLWGYGTSTVVTKHRLLGEFVIAEQTEPFDVQDVEFFPSLMETVDQRLSFRPKRFTGDAAFDAWYVYDWFAKKGGTAYVPLNLRGHAKPRFGDNGFHMCEDDREMIGASIFQDRTRGYQAQREICPVLFGNLPEDQTCRIQHENFQKGTGCVKHKNLEVGARVRVELDRSSDEFKREYKWRTMEERIFSQAKELGIERPRLRNIHSIRNQNTLIYIVINAHALKRVREAKLREIT
ncbi:MAG: hypothetical protein ACE1ZS_05800 [Candidatus Poribacteria bacterium]